MLRRTLSHSHFDRIFFCRVVHVHVAVVVAYYPLLISFYFSLFRNFQIVFSAFQMDLMNGIRFVISIQKKWNV